MFFLQYLHFAKVFFHLENTKVMSYGRIFDMIYLHAWQFLTMTLFFLVRNPPGGQSTLGTFLADENCHVT